MKKIQKILIYLFKEIFLLCFGGSVYITIEIIARGFSHWSMFLLGGICFIIIGLLNECYDWKLLFQKQCIIGALTITILEFITGCIINLQLHWNVWDYSDRPFNLLGQICLHHSIFYWIPLSAIAIIVDDLLRYALFKEQYPKYYFRKPE